LLYSSELSLQSLHHETFFLFSCYISILVIFCGNHLIHYVHVI
jgi:hypothetical protein